MNETSLRDMIAKLEQLRNSRVILYAGQDRGHFPHVINEDDMLPLFQCLRQIGRVEHLDLVLYSGGGSIPIARTICQILHSYGQHISILVPYKARSAGTLLCLGAHEIVMGPLGELGPIDPQIASTGPQPSSNPPTISAEDIRTFQQMAKAWFGIEGAEQNIHLLRLLCERIFPPSLTSFFRAAQQIQMIAEELLQQQLPDSSLERRQEIVEYFTYKCYSHDYAVTRADATKIGLVVTYPSYHEEELLWQIWQRCYQQIIPPITSITPIDARRNSIALVASTDFTAKNNVHVFDIHHAPHMEVKQQNVPSILEMHWEVTDEPL